MSNRDPYIFWKKRGRSRDDDRLDEAATSLGERLCRKRYARYVSDDDDGGEAAS